MDISKENLYNFSKFKNVIKDLYKCERAERGGGAKTALSPTFSCNAKNQYL